MAENHRLLGSVQLSRPENVFQVERHPEGRILMNFSFELLFGCRRTFNFIFVVASDLDVLGYRPAK